jgi:hypothetical protein
MSFQYTYDANGKPVGVFVPITEWNKITGTSKRKKLAPRSASKEKILQYIENGFNQVNRIEKGKLKSVSLKQLLDAL